MAQMNLSVKQKKREQTCGCRGKGKGKGLEGEFGVDRRQRITFRMDKQQCPKI